MDPMEFEEGPGPLFKKQTKAEHHQHESDLSGLDYWSPGLHTSMTIEKTEEEMLPPQGGVNALGHIKFVIPAQPEGVYLDLASTLLWVKITQIHGDDGDARVAADPVTYTNCIFHTMWHTVDLVLNGNLVSESMQLYGYKGLLQTLLSHDTDWKETTGKLIGWYQIEKPAEEPDDWAPSTVSQEATEGMLESWHYTGDGTRTAHTANKFLSGGLRSGQSESKKAREFLGRLALDLFNINTCYRRELKWNLPSNQQLTSLLFLQEMIPSKIRAMSWICSQLHYACVKSMSILLRYPRQWPPDTFHFNAPNCKY